MDRAAMPRPRSRAMSASTRACEARTPAASCRPSLVTSYQARMTAPPLMVTGWQGAWGKTKRTAGAADIPSSGTMGSKSWPSAPRPWSQMTAARGAGPVSISIVSSRPLMPGSSRA